MVLLTIAAGIIFLLYGKSLFRWIIIINAMILAGWVGWRIGLSFNRPWLVAIGLALVWGILAWPLFKFGVAILCGLAGMVFAMQIATLFDRGPIYAPVFAIAGFVVFAVLGWLLLMGAITIFTAMEGSAMIIVSAVILAQRAGILPLLTPDRMGIIRAAIIILGIIGILYQFGFTSRHIKATPSTNVTKH